MSRMPGENRRRSSGVPYWATYKNPTRSNCAAFNNYMAHQHLEKVIPRFITSCILDEPLIVHGTGEAARDWILLKTPGLSRKLLFSAKTISWVKYLTWVPERIHRSCKLLIWLPILMKVKNPKIELIQDRPGQVLRHTCDYSKASSTTDWTPATSLEEGLLKPFNGIKPTRIGGRSSCLFRHFPIFLEDGTKVMH